MNEKLDLYDDDAYRKNSGQETEPSMSDLIKTCVNKDIIEYIGTYLNYKDQRALASTCRWFNDKGYPVSKHAKHLLERVVRGDLSTVEQFFKTNTKQHIHDVLCKPVTITDLSAREFPYITAFQYALWALDKPMWELILRYLSEEQACLQLRALEENRDDIIKTHGAHFSFDLIVERLQYYIDHYDGWNYNQNEDYWCKKVGGAQRDFPAWLIMTMCEKGKDVSWTKQDVTMSVKRAREHLKRWHECRRGQLGVEWGAVRGEGYEAMRTPIWTGVPSVGIVIRVDTSVRVDREHLAHISSARSHDLARLKAKLSPKVSSLATFV